MSQAFKWESQSRLMDEVAQVLRERIYSGVYEPGATLRQERIAAEFGISRTPLREAFRVLERDGLVVNQPYSGVRVATADLRKLLDAYAVRKAMDSVAAGNAAERATGSEIEQLERSVERQKEIIDNWNPGDYTQANVEFHLKIMQAARNASLEPLAPLVHLTSQVFTPAFALSSDRASAAIAEHCAILEAIRERDADKAERVAGAHINGTIVGLKMLLAEQANAGA